MLVNFSIPGIVENPRQAGSKRLDVGHSCNMCDQVLRSSAESRKCDIQGRLLRCRAACCCFEPAAGRAERAARPARADGHMRYTVMQGQTFASRASASMQHGLLRVVEKPLPMRSFTFGAGAAFPQTTACKLSTAAYA